MWVFFEHFLTVLGFGLCALLIIRLLGAHRPPGVTFAWLLAIALIPYVGVPAYFLLGGRKYKRMAERKSSLYGNDTDSSSQSSTALHTTEQILITAGMPPARSDNHIDFLPNGEAGYDALVSLIEEARHSIYMMTFILRADKTGRAIIDLLARRAAEGIEVRVLLDALGCFWTSRRFVQPIRAAGGSVEIFMPVLPLRRKWSANLRNHRKITVVDGQAAMVGGMNIADEYMGLTPNPDRWLDAGIIVRGPAAMDLASIFASDWHFASDETLELTNGFQGTSPETGDTEKTVSLAQVAASGPDTPEDATYEALLTATLKAEQRIWIVTPYFIPDEPLLKALLLQTRLGRDVRIIVPGNSNHPIADLARGPALRDLSKMGARVYLYPRMVHAKLALYDQNLAVVGSANSDQRSFYLNYEVLLFMYAQEDVFPISQWMEARMAESTTLEPGPVSRMRAWAEDVSALVAPLL